MQQEFRGGGWLSLAPWPRAAGRSVAEREERRTSVCSRCMSPTSNLFPAWACCSTCSDALEAVRRGPAIAHLVGIAFGNHLVIRGGDEALARIVIDAAVRRWAQSRTTRSPLGPARAAAQSRSCAAEPGRWSALRYCRRGRHNTMFSEGTFQRGMAASNSCQFCARSTASEPR